MNDTAIPEQPVARYTIAHPAPPGSSGNAAQTGITTPEIRSVVAQSSRGSVRLRYAPKHPQPADQGTRTD
jgi:hypothetical protein